MDKPTSLVAQTHIVEFLRTRPGKEYTAKQIASQFRISLSTVGVMYRNLEKEGWRVHKDRFAGTTYFSVWPPEKAKPEAE